jgi:hypothetical protein
LPNGIFAVPNKMVEAAKQARIDKKLSVLLGSSTDEWAYFRE